MSEQADHAEAAPGWGRRLINFFASYSFVTISFLVYLFSPHTSRLRAFTNRSMDITGTEVLVHAYAIYSLILLVFYLVERDARPSKSIAAWRALRALATAPARVAREGLPRGDRLGLLSVLVKGFYAPIMLLSLFQFISTMVANGVYIYLHAADFQGDYLRLFNSNGFWFLFQLILFLDVFFFTIGYLVEHPALKNEIRSVDPSWLGWAVTLACYPPFNILTAQVLGGNIADFPQFENPAVHIGLNVVMLLLMALYASASVALNLKASNLTHRGIVSRGPYRFVRHPAYAAKNMAWWVGALPAIMVAWEKSAWDVVLAISCVIAWSALYVLRALTEETHLRGVDGDYDAYSEKVRYRFIPGVW